MNNYLTLRNRRSPNNKQNTRTDNATIVTQYFMKLLEDFKDFPYLSYRKIQVKNEPTEAYLFMVKKSST